VFQRMTSHSPLPKVLVDAVIGTILRNIDCEFDEVWSKYEGIIPQDFF
jgi:hypothetical protein